MISFAYVFAILIVTLGPLKIIPVFYAQTRQADAPYRRKVALKAFVVSSIVVYGIALFASDTLNNWKVSIDALMIAGGIILFVGALHSVVAFEVVELPDKPAIPVAGATATPEPRWMGKPVLSPIVVPAIVTPAAVVAIIFFMAQASTNAADSRAVLMILGLILVLNLIGMLLANLVMRLIGLQVLQLVGWVFAVLQAGLAVQAILSALRRLEIIP